MGVPRWLGVQFSASRSKKNNKEKRSTVKSTAFYLHRRFSEEFCVSSTDISCSTQQCWSFEPDQDKIKRSSRHSTIGMVVTRSQGDAAETEARETERREEERRNAERREAERRERERAERERERIEAERRERAEAERHERECAERERERTEREHVDLEHRERAEFEHRERADYERYKRVEQERRRLLFLNPPASPTVLASGDRPTTDTRIRETPNVIADETWIVPASEDRPRARSPAASVHSRRSNMSATTRQRLLELEAAERLANLKRRELEIEADLIRKRLDADVAALQDEEESLHGEAPPRMEGHRKVNDWLQSNPLAARGEGGDSRGRTTDSRALRFDVPKGRSPTPARNKNDIEQLAETLEKMARPRLRHTDLPVFSGLPTEWLPFQAAMRDSTKMYDITPAENLQRLRSCLKGEARDVVAALLHTATDPEAIMKTLEQCFGRPEVIIDRAFDDLRRLPRPGSSATELNNFAIKLQNVTCVLKNIDRRGYLYNPMLAREVLDKLSPHLRSRWCDYAIEHDGSSDPDIILLSRFLMREADRALRYTYAPPTSTTTATTAKKETKGNTVAKKKPNAVYSVDASEEQTEHCPKCEKKHSLTQCPDYKALSINERWDFVKNQKLCFKCAQRKHRRSSCKAKPCGVKQCRRPHHASLHNEDRSVEPAGTSGSTCTDSISNQGSNNAVAVLSVSARGRRAVLLKVCPVVVKGPKGEVETYALLDEGATVTLVDEDLAKQIGAEGPSQPLHLQGVNMSQSETDSKIVMIQIRGKGESDQGKLKARTVKNLKLHQQSVPEKLLEHEHLRDLLQEQVCYDQVQPAILVGTDHWEYIVSRELRVGKPTQPAASRTLLGWVVHGTVPRSIVSDSESVLHIYEPTHRANEKELYEEKLHELVEQYFRIDSLGIAHKPRVSDADRRAIEIVKNTIKKTEKGYEVGLPWVKEEIKMPPSYEAAARRLYKIEQKMDASPAFAKEYTAQIENLLVKGYATPCDGSEEGSAVTWFLPHFAVQNPNKPGKHRLVFNAAARSRGVCLNDFLLDGPNLLLSLQGIVFRFRERRIAITADIQEMFLQVKIIEKDQPAQQFLWRQNEREAPPKRFKMTSMIFGAASSPFMAHYVRDHNAREHAHTHTRALEAITKEHYMDDFVASYEEEEEARRTIEEVRTVHAVAGFTLRGWRSSDRNVLRDVPETLQAAAQAPLGKEGPEDKILGLMWNSDKDELGFNTAMNRVPEEVRTGRRAPTKREALSTVMSIYDPLGLLSHYTIRAKIILQSLWRLKMTWDEPIPAEENELFTSWLQQLDEIAKLRLRRCYTLERYKYIELHILCDASEQAYSTVAYWRVTRHDESTDVVLVAAKAKVAPRRTQTIPRLELQAAVIGARLADTIKREHRIEVTRTVYWTDSTTVVQWIRHDAQRYTPFVAHRLGEISELTQKEEWRWLPTNQNVADEATRFSCSPIKIEDRWFRGPQFLYEREEYWPVEGSPEAVEEEVNHVIDTVTPPEDWLPDPARFSKYETLVRTMARVLAFIDICKRRVKRLERDHIERAERILIQQAQRESFGPEIRRMQSARPIPKTSRLYKLDPVIQDGILRVRGRIGASSAPVETKQPIILDGRHRLTKLLVQKEHCVAGHANRERVTNDLRQRFWIIHLRPTVRAIERQCALCQRRKATPQPPTTGNLPRARLDPFHRPFTNCGVDFFGPMVVKVGRRHEKRWGALFTCLTTRAVHLELVHTLNTDSAIMALRRMAARRGWPRTIYSDNGTNFRGADHELRAAYDEWAPALHEEGLKHRVDWRFIPPNAPNQGGAWERLVRSVKNALSATLREKTPSDEMLRTLLTEAEFSINARPLTHVSVDPADPEALTPNHFLLGSSMGLPTTGPCEEADRRTWRATQALADQFWRRWVREYLPTLVPRGEPTNLRRPLQTGDVVIIADHTLPRNTWPMGIIERVYPGTDGGVRVADVRTKTGTFKRPASRLIVLPKEEAAHASPGGEYVKD